eukprot:CFRG2785T1
MSCAPLREEFVKCLLESDCIRVDKKHASECVKPDSGLSDECRNLQKLFFECKRGQLDMRNRFRGNKAAV